MVGDTKLTAKFLPVTACYDGDVRRILSYLQLDLNLTSFPPLN